MVILLLAILAAVAIPNFQDFRTEARNAAAQGSLGGIRAAVAVARATIALKEDPTVSQIFPTILEMQANNYDGSHPVIAALAAANKRIMDGSPGGYPLNPWSLQTVPLPDQRSVWNCSTLTQSYVRSTTDEQNFGWCYNATTGQAWANSQRNGGSAGNTENNF